MQSKEFSGKTPKTQNTTSLDLSEFTSQLLVAKMLRRSGGEKPQRKKKDPKLRKRRRAWMFNQAHFLSSTKALNGASSVFFHLENQKLQQEQEQHDMLIQSKYIIFFTHT
jgi:hypothetical protein